MLVRLCVADFCFLVVSCARSVAQAATVRSAVCPCVVTVTCSGRCECTAHAMAGGGTYGVSESRAVQQIASGGGACVKCPKIGIQVSRRESSEGDGTREHVKMCSSCVRPEGRVPTSVRE